MDAQPGTTALEEPAPPVRPRRRAPRPLPELDPCYGHLCLDALRAYRQVLAEEEHRVSYWRRILQARLDLLRAGLDGSTAHPLDTEALRPVLADARAGAGRQALVDVLPDGGLPPLPLLAELWQQQVDPADAAGCARLGAALATAERQLSDYRTALHRRIGEATGELIARYREAPALCLSALPLPSGPRAASR